MFDIINILLLILIIAGFVTLVTFPFWKHHSRWWMKLAKNTTPYVTWIALTAAGVGAQSLANIVEILFVTCFHIVMEFLFWVLRFKYRKELPVCLPTVITIIFAIALRLVMPVIPE